MRRIETNPNLMKLNKLFLALCLFPSLLSAQQYGLEVEVVNEDIGVLVGALGNY